jgi:uncharacterized lipoprotein YmbA
MNISQFCLRLVGFCAAGLCLVGCSLLNPPKGITSRSFVLTPIPGAAPSAQSGLTNTIVGIRPVRVPAYLFGKSFAMRQGSNEIVYLESAEWAEPLDTALQRVLASDLGALIPTDRVRLSLWGPDEVTVEVAVNVERFDMDSHGEGVLWAWWRVLSPGGENVLASGRFVTTRKGRPPTADPGQAAASMSGMAADLAQRLAEAIKRPER